MNALYASSKCRRELRPRTKTSLGRSLPGVVVMGMTMADFGSSSHTRTGYPAIRALQSSTRTGRRECSARRNGHPSSVPPTGVPAAPTSLGGTPKSLLLCSSELERVLERCECVYPELETDTDAMDEMPCELRERRRLDGVGDVWLEPFRAGLLNATASMTSAGSPGGGTDTSIDRGAEAWLVGTPTLPTCHSLARVRGGDSE